MSLLRLFNLSGKPKQELTKPRENVGRQIISDGLEGKKIQPYGISESSEYKFKNKYWQGPAWLSFDITGSPTEITFEKENDGMVLFTFQAHNFFIDNNLAVDRYINLLTYIYLDDVQLSPYHVRNIYTLAGVEESFSVHLSCLLNVDKGSHKLQVKAGVDNDPNMFARLIGTPEANIILSLL